MRWILIIGATAAVLLLCGQARIGASRTAQTKVTIQTVVAALQLYKSDHRIYPKQLLELTNNSVGTIYFAGDLSDAWGHSLIYEAPDRDSPGRIGSFGADRKPGGTGVNQDYVLMLRTK